MTDTRTVKRSLMSWGTGRSYLPRPIPEGTAAVVMLENPDHLRTVLHSDVVGAGTVVFTPPTDAVPDDAPGPRVFTYEGSPTEPGGELTVGDGVFIQVEDYASSQYMSLIGPTLVRVIEPEDFPAFLTDADRAVAEGRFPEFATHPAVQFADEPALGAGPVDDGPRLRLHLSPDGEWSTSATGVAIGQLGASWHALADAWRRHNATSAQPCAVCLGHVVAEPERVSALAARPWLGYYLSALATQRDLAARRLVDVHLSGFGGRLSPRLAGMGLASGDGFRVPEPGEPVLAWTEDVALLHLPGAGRTFQLNIEAAAVVEALLVCGSVDAAADYADRDQLLAVRDQMQAGGVRIATNEDVDR